jgi:hypothetical protein
VLSRFDDKAIDQTKIERAADILDGVAEGGKPGRRFGYTRAYGAWAWGVTYANAHLTDGLLTRRAIEKYRIGSAECDALVAAGSWDVVEGGYQIHDFLDWNPSAAEVKAKQSKDRDRKRKAAGYQTDSARNPCGVAADSFASRADARAPSGLGRDGTGEEEPSMSDDLGREPERGAPALELSSGQLQAAVPGLVGAWNNLCAVEGSPFQSVTVRSHPKATAALRGHPDINWWADLFARVARSDWLRRDARIAPVDFWWVLEHVEEIAAGRYDNRVASLAVLPPTKTEQRAARRAAATAAVIASYAEEPVS